MWAHWGWTGGGALEVVEASSAALIPVFLTVWAVGVSVVAHGIVSSRSPACPVSKLRNVGVGPTSAFLVLVSVVLSASLSPAGLASTL